MINKIMDLGISKTEASELLAVSKDIEKDYLKLKDGYPIQYLIGYVDFYGYRINITPDVLIPRYETEYLVEKTIKYSEKLFANKNVKVLDLGTGSGSIAISMAKNINSDVTAVDISQEALGVAKNNAILNNVEINFINSDMLDKVEGKFDVIISNPPYISKDENIMEIVDKYEPHLALYAEDDGLYFYKNILDNIKDYLNDKFLIAFEIGWWQGELISEYASSIFKTERIVIEKDLTNRNRYIFIISE